VDTLAREKSGSVKRSNNEIPLSRMANVHFGNVYMDSLANFSSALLHHGDQNARLIPFVENITKTLLRNFIPKPMIPELWGILIT
jgi:tetrahydromethanopterin S-methyltransferase subunit E